MADFSDDLAQLLQQPVPGTGLRYSQGELVGWNSETFENAVLWRGVVLRNLSVLPSVDALSFEPGDVLGLLGWNPNGGAASWWILGKVDQPPLGEPASIKSGNLVVEGGGSVIVRDGGDVTVGDDGRIYAGSDALNRFIAIGDGQIQFGTDSSGDITSELFFSPTTSAVRWDLFGGGALFLRERDATGTGIILALDAELSPGVFTGTHSFGVGHTVLAHTEIGAGTPNVDMLSNGLIRRITSSSRYKTGIRDFHVSPRTVLDLKPRTWQDKKEAKKSPDTAHWHVGFIAEELHDLGLTPFVNYDGDGKPDSIAYTQLSVALLEVCQWQQRQIDLLTERVNALSSEPLDPVPEPATTELPLRKEVLPDLPSGPSRV